LRKELLMNFPPFPEEEGFEVNDRIQQLEEAGVSTDDLQARVVALRSRDPKSLSDAELKDAVACSMLHRRTTSGPPKAKKAAAKKVEVQSLLADL
jgi:hypothetical protein